MAPAISLRRLAVTYRTRGGEVRALHDLDLQIEAGHLVAILGPNGSGKSTLLRVLAGLQRPQRGEARVFGLPPDAPALAARVGYQPEGPLPFGVLSAAEYLAWVGTQIGLSNRDSDQRARHWLDRLELANTGRRWIRDFSTGMQKRLALASALLGDPALLLLDEPTAGLDPIGTGIVLEVLRDLAAAGRTVLLASHHLLEVEALCEDAVVLQDGCLRARGPLAGLLGTDAHQLVVRGLDAAGLQQLTALTERLGGEVLRCEREREPLFALFRRIAGKPAADASGADRSDFEATP
jgi:ABC-2 type transport system ATP-binding protein